MNTRYFAFDDGKYWMDNEELAPLGDNEFRVETTRSLVSVGTETACNTGKSGWSTGRHGYSNVGRVTAVGKDVKEIAEGTRFFSAATHTDVYQCTADAGFVVPDGVTDDEAIFASLGVVAMHVIERAAIVFGQPVVVVGLGTVGQLTQQLARLSGAGTVIGVDLDAACRERALALGADVAIPPTEEALNEALSNVVSSSPKPVFIDVTGSAAAVSWIFKTAPLHSRIILAGAYLDSFEIDPNSIVRGEFTVCGAHQPKCPGEQDTYYPYSKDFNYNGFFSLVEKRKLKVDTLSDGSISPDELIGFYESASKKEASLRQPVLKWS